MRAYEYGGCRPWNVSRGGMPPSYDPYNRALKGGERREPAKEYASSGMEEYYHYPASQDLTKEDSDQQSNTQQNDLSKKLKTNLSRDLITKLVGIAAGATIVATSYQARVSSQRMDAQLPPDPPAASETATDGTDSSDSANSQDGADSGANGGQNGDSAAIVNDQTDSQDDQDDTQDDQDDQDDTKDEKSKDEKDKTKDEKDQSKEETDKSKDETDQSKDEKTEDKKEEVQVDIGATDTKAARLQWHWNTDDPYAVTADADVTNKAGVVSDITAVITYEDVLPATCTETGTRMYTAEITDVYGNKYKDTRTVTMPALGHSFVESTQSTAGTLRYHCTACDQDFVFTYTVRPE